MATGIAMLGSGLIRTLLLRPCPRVGQPSCKRSRWLHHVSAPPYGMMAAGFHGGDAVAQLKPLLGAGADGGGGGFHGGDAVAQLKLGLRVDLPSADRRFPRRRRRGSIEATVMRTLARRSVRGFH